MAPTAVVIPLYIYPTPGAWGPLVQTAKANPLVPFVAIVNPNNGPGKTALPDASYQEALAELCSVPNITLLGYVHCQWCKRAGPSIESDIDVYASWDAESDGRFSVSGIFIDEAPWEPCHRAYMRTLADYIRHTFAEETGTRGIVCYNPGVVVEKGYLDDCDLAVVFEQSHKEWYAYFLRKGLVQIPYNLRSKCVAMVHSFGRLDDCGANTNGHGNGNAHGQGHVNALALRASIDLDGSHAGGADKAATALTDQITELGFGGVFLTEQVGGYSRFPETWDTVASRLTQTQPRLS
ncbi:hypothetical protein CcaverHIS002_0609400 [Cutaneotrichosporon cavernicola]|uniref:Spherulin-4 n=1 Tax=Cutaneotrichosporon cavernicola TaxID=279322 RepID=A0AA48QYE2_9TREE|nr:uncharacterized protein CcaverHIS019_0608860 [Cutaneotrichosporon cavernicola]BEI86653.1 hypothetical protein CcaverHIS002_0609400 [Cutaneotrichosporon cavernicola]BEI94427.1 hypothetical protein CcaverHIS019_0608860 [Cutaneotrichosporon cavernicola]BEJ02204.1 hypothetical protein CcaverHIS631_0608860 [Cutaneotrichosporon cavernicola]BEJ09965.1 hypothetical protein CcaverHIS641_0608800 [Cutaneotrichosporon cavernicola]